jgi:hypothetical protein
MHLLFLSTGELCDRLQPCRAGLDSLSVNKQSVNKHMNGHMSVHTVSYVCLHCLSRVLADCPSYVCAHCLFCVLIDCPSYVCSQCLFRFLVDCPSYKTNLSLVQMLLDKVMGLFRFMQVFLPLTQQSVPDRSRLHIERQRTGE